MKYNILDSIKKQVFLEIPLLDILLISNLIIDQLRSDSSQNYLTF